MDVLLSPGWAATPRHHHQQQRSPLAWESHPCISLSTFNWFCGDFGQKKIHINLKGLRLTNKEATYWPNNSSAEQNRHCTPPCHTHKGTQIDYKYLIPYPKTDCH